MKLLSRKFAKRQFALLVAAVLILLGSTALLIIYFQGDYTINLISLAVYISSSILITVSVLKYRKKIQLNFDI